MTLLGVLTARPSRPWGDDSFAAAPEPGFCAPFWVDPDPDRRAPAAVAEDARRHPRRPEFWIALSLAYLRASVDQPDFVLQALEAEERARELSPSNPRAAFLRAVIFQSLGLRNEAKHAIDVLLRVDPRPAVRKAIAPCLEAIERSSEEERWRLALPRLTSRGAGAADPELVRAVDSSRQSARLYGEQTLLPLWAKATLDGEPERASRALALARGIGSALASRNGDRLLLDAALAVGRPGFAADSLDSMARGLVDFRAALTAFEVSDVATAEPLFQGAARRLREARSPMELWARYYMAYCQFQRQGEGFERALEMLRELDSELRGTAYLSLAGRVYRLTGTVHSVISRPAEALIEQNRALQVFRRLGERDNAAGAEIRLAIACDVMGRPGEAWRHRVMALRGMGDFDDAASLTVILDDAAKALALERPEWALLFVEEAVARISRAPGAQPALRVGLERRKATLLLQLGRVGLAEGAMARSREALLQIRPGKVRRNTELESVPIEVALAAQRDVRGAVEMLTEALQRVDETEYQYYLSRLLLQRGLLWERLKESARALADFERGILEREREAIGVGDRLDRVSLLDRNANLFDAAIDLLIEKGDPSRAREIKERSRARLLKERWTGASRSHLWKRGEPGEQFELPDLANGEAVLEFHLGRKGLSIWVLREGKVALIASSLSPPRLEAELGALRQSLTRGGRTREFESASSALFDALLAPALPSLAGISRLVVVPDAFLWQVPFSVLLDRRTDRLAVQVWEISVAPTAAARPASPKPSAGARQEPIRAFLVGTGEPNLARNPGLDRLPQVEQELRAIAGRYPGAQVRLGEAATRSAFLEGLRRAELVHFGGHALWNDNSPALSTLLFSDGNRGQEPGDVYLYELLGLDLSRVKLVVLGGCATGRGIGSRSEGPLSLALPFLARGAEGVVAALWNIDDRQAAAYLTEVHRQYARGYGAAAAVTRAKRRFLAGAPRRIDAVRAWAPFELSALAEGRS
jgi:CHAT domain-containing protein